MNKKNKSGKRILINKKVKVHDFIILYYENWLHLYHCFIISK